MNFYFDMVGCRLNQSEIELMANQLHALGHAILSDPTQADVIIINTCCVTAKAAADSRKMIRHYASNHDSKLVVTGCWGTLFSEEAISLPGVTHVVANPQKENLVKDLLSGVTNLFNDYQYRRHPIPGNRQRTRAFIKVQDGCDEHCTYCITRIARGESKSLPFEMIKKEVNAAIEGEVKEIVLSGVQLGSWGKDLEPKQRIGDLIASILEDERLARLRLSSIEPWDLYPEVFELWKDSRLCRHLHIPLQSGSEKILKRMARRIKPAAYQTLIDQAREEITGIAITTDIIVGFPGETDADFQESVEFVTKMQFSGGHVFSYSAMPGTFAATLPNQVDSAKRKRRNLIMRDVIAKSQERFFEKSLKQITHVLWEKFEDRNGKVYLSGLTDNYIRTLAESNEDLRNRISLVRLDELDHHGGMIGEIVG